MVQVSWVAYVLRPLLFAGSAVLMGWAASVLFVVTDAPNNPLQDLAEPIASTEVEREVEITVPPPALDSAAGRDDQAADPLASRAIEFRLTLRIDQDDPLSERVQAGALDANPASAARLGIADLDLFADVDSGEITSDRLEQLGEPYRAEWSTPVVTIEDGKTVAVISGRFPADAPELASVLVRPPDACVAAGDDEREQLIADCPVQVRLTAEQRRIASVYPASAVVGRSADGVDARVGRGGEPAWQVTTLRIDVAAPDGSLSPLAVAERGWLTGLWRYAWQMLPWLLLFGYVLRLRARPAGGDLVALDRPQGALARLLWAALVSAVLVALVGIDREYGSSSVLAAGPVVVGLWAWHAHRWVWQRASLVRTVTLVVLGAAGVVLLLVAGRGLGEVGPGITLAVAGGVLAAVALEPRVASVPAGLAAASTLVALSLTQRSTAALDSWLSGSIALFLSMAFLVMLVWVAAIGTSSAMMDKARQTHWIRLLTVVAALALLWPDEPAPLASAPIRLQSYVTDFAAATPALVWFGLILVVVGLLWGVAERPPPGPEIRALAILVSLALLLRSNVVVGLPWSFIVGALLIVGVLYVRPEQVVQHRLWPPGDGREVARIQHLVQASANAQFARSLRAAARSRATSPDASLEEAEAYRQAYRDRVEPTPPPSDDERDRALGWGAVPDPRKRAQRSMVAALLVGIPLSVPYLTAVAAQLSSDNLTSVTTWGEIVTAFIFVLRFPLYGFVFGYFFPLIRGSTGLGKSLHLLAVLVVSEGITLLVPFGSTDAFLEAFSLRALGLVLLCLVLGIGADAWALRRAGAGLADLPDLYQVRRATLSISTVAVAALTTAATTLATLGVTSAAERLFEKTETRPVEAAQPSEEEPRG